MTDEDLRAAGEARREELDALAARMVGMTRQDARALADEHGIQLRVRDRVGVAYTNNAVVGRFTVWAYEGTVTRVSRG